MLQPNRFYVTLSLALVLFLLGLVTYWAWRMDRLTQHVQESLNVVIELETDHTLEERRQLLAYLGEATFTHPLRMPEYESKEAALDQLDGDFVEDLEALGVNNPLLDVVTFNVRLDYMEADSLERVADAVQLQPGVAGVYYQLGVFEEVAVNARRITYVLLALTLLFLGIAMVLIHNTVRLSLAANRLLIKTQELVGASWGFIARPYLWRGAWQGALAGCLALLGLGGVLLAAHQYLPELDVLREPEALAVIGGGLVTLGVVVSLISYYVGVRRYLRIPIDRL